MFFCSFVYTQNMGKIRVGVIFGGKSAEHEVSIQSAKNIISALSPDKYEVVPIGIDKQGAWHLIPLEGFKKEITSTKLVELNPKAFSSKPTKVAPTSNTIRSNLDILFPVLHGPLGEDGTVQGLLTLVDIPFVGSGVLGSAVSMDKDVMKRLAKAGGLEIANFISFTEANPASYSKIVGELQSPFFVKPANLGSSVGISKVRTENEYKKALECAFLHDHKIVVEEYIEGREIECSVLGNDDPIASLPGEIIPHHDFYSYKAKYLDEKGAALRFPAKLSSIVVSEVQRCAIEAFKLCCVEGFARVDFFLTQENRVIFNEINTIPGFTKISMYPKLWEVSGLPYEKLLDKLIELGLEKSTQRKKLHR